MAYGKQDSTVSFEIVKHIGTLSVSKTEWATELNLVSWNGKEPKYDIRAWSPDHDKMGKGITLTEAELVSLSAIINSHLSEE